MVTSRQHAAVSWRSGWPRTCRVGAIARSWGGPGAVITSLMPAAVVLAGASPLLAGRMGAGQGDRDRPMSEGTIGRGP